jgi:hypothetical protein
MPIERIRDELSALVSAAHGELTAPDRTTGEDSRSWRRRTTTGLQNEWRELRRALHGRCVAAEMSDAVPERVMQRIGELLQGFDHWHAVPPWAPAYTIDRHRASAAELQRLELLQAMIKGDLDVVLQREPQGKGRRRMTVAEANEKAMRLAKRLGKTFFRLSETEQAERIKCSWQTWARTDFYPKAQAKRPGGKRSTSPAPKVQRITPPLEAVLHEDKALNELVAEQAADNEPSPLEDDHPVRPHKVYSSRRL